jgi:hypothetical protein
MRYQIRPCPPMAVWPTSEDMPPSAGWITGVWGIIDAERIEGR